MLQPSAKSLRYVYMHDTAATSATPVLQSQSVTLKNSAVLPLQFMLKCAPPFSVDGSDRSLLPGETLTVTVDFDPTYRKDRVSHIAEGKLVAVYSNHARRDHVELVGDINYPNLRLEYSQVDFGCILNDTTKSMVVKVENVSKIPCVLAWSFLADDDAVGGTGTSGVCTA